jgi:hypothetical protein
MPKGDNPKSRENLIPFNELTEEELRKATSNGGKKSVQKRRELKTLKEELKILLSLNETQEKISLALLQQALKGNVKAFEVVRDTIGQKPTDVIENINPPVIKISDLKI